MLLILVFQICWIWYSTWHFSNSIKLKFQLVIHKNYIFRSLGYEQNYNSLITISLHFVVFSSLLLNFAFSIIRNEFFEIRIEALNTEKVFAGQSIMVGLLLSYIPYNFSYFSLVTLLIIYCTLVIVDIIYFLMLLDIYFLFLLATPIPEVSNFRIFFDYEL